MANLVTQKESSCERAENILKTAEKQGKISSSDRCAITSHLEECDKCTTKLGQRLNRLNK
ncbi:MAG: hypothetical protein ABH837_01040 [bacterium]